MLTCTKVWSDIPFAHRAPFHDGHCKLIHGHNWTFEVTFQAESTDKNGFVFDFGKLKGIKKTIDDTFDHAFVLAANDPLRSAFEIFTREANIHNIITLDDCSAEGIAKFVFGLVDSYIIDETDARVSVRQVTVREDTRNSATYSR